MVRLRFAVLSLFVVSVPVTVEAETVILNPTKDNMLVESATGHLSNGAGNYFFAGVTGQVSNNIRRSVIAFDIAGNIPAGATINSVTLRLNLSNTAGGNASISLHRLTADWGEGTSQAPSGEGIGGASTTGDATWIHRFHDTQFWTTPGGDFEATPSATTLVTTAFGIKTWSSSEMAGDVQGWLDNPATNFGWLLKADAETSTNAKRFDSRSNTFGTRPELEIDYSAEATVTNWVIF